MPMIGRPTEVTAPNGREYTGQIFFCTTCLGEEFKVFWVDGQAHPHFECVICNHSFCGSFDGKPCELPDQ